MSSVGAVVIHGPPGVHVGSRPSNLRSHTRVSFYLFVFVQLLAGLPLAQGIGHGP